MGGPRTEEVAHGGHHAGRVQQELRELAGEVISTHHRHDAVHQRLEEAPERAGPLEKRPRPVQVHVAPAEGELDHLGQARRHRRREADEAEVVDRVGVLGKVRVAVQPGVQPGVEVEGVELLEDDEAPERRDAHATSMRRLVGATIEVSGFCTYNPMLSLGQAL